MEDRWRSGGAWYWRHHNVITNTDFAPPIRMQTFTRTLLALPSALAQAKFLLLAAAANIQTNLFFTAENKTNQKKNFYHH
jgi:hypothetical protein